MEQPIWDAVAELELEQYTREEIAEALRRVANTVEGFDVQTLKDVPHESDEAVDETYGCGDDTFLE